MADSRDRRHLRHGDVPAAFRPGSLQTGGGAPVPVHRRDHPRPIGSVLDGVATPVGVVAAIAPWNAAQILSARSIAAPLALGNTVVLKPSELSPYVGGLIWAEIFSEAGLPEGVLNIVARTRRGRADRRGIRRAPAVRVINFTGSTETGRKVAEAAGRNLARRPRAGRVEPARRPRRRRPGVRGGRMRVRLVLPPGSDLHVRPQDHRGEADRRRLRRLVEKTKGLKAGNPNERTRSSAADHRGAVSTVKSRVDEAVERRGILGWRGGRLRLPGHAPDERFAVTEFAQERRSGRSRRSRSWRTPTRR